MAPLKLETAMTAFRGSFFDIALLLVPFGVLWGNSDDLPIDGQRRAGGDRFSVAQLAPEVVRDGGGKCGAVFRDSLGSTGTRDDRSRGRMGEQEPQRGGLDGD